MFKLHDNNTLGLKLIKVDNDNDNDNEKEIE